MIIKDRAYGKISITDKLILDLIKSAPMQRLRKIKQAGPTALLEPQRVITRFEHSIGVWYLLKRFKASLEEQVAGLLHDTPHTAFSHVADVVFPNETHTFHEKFEEKIILSSEIPSILARHGMKIEKILDKSNFALLEAELPDLSADRIDYFLRDTRIDPIFPDDLVTSFLKDLGARDSKFYFKSKSLAILYALLFLDAGRLLWLDPNSHGSHELLGAVLKKALDMKILTMDDFFTTDDEVLNILKKSTDKTIRKSLIELSPKTDFVYAAKSDARFWARNKPRMVDPFVEVQGKLVRTSEVFPELNRIFEDFRNNYLFIGVK